MSGKKRGITLTILAVEHLRYNIQPCLCVTSSKFLYFSLQTQSTFLHPRTDIADTAAHTEEESVSARKTEEMDEECLRRLVRRNVSSEGEGGRGREGAKAQPIYWSVLS